MTEAITITEKENTQDVFDIRYLRETGIALLQKYSGNLWTDYNIHDPGITLLEAICLALAEIGYRADYDIAEILGKLHLPGPGSPFPPAETVLPSAPVTIDDTRRLLLGIEGVRNVRIRPSSAFPEFAGLFEVDIQLSEDSETDERKNEVGREVRDKLDACRKPGEDFVSVRFLESEYIGFELDIEVENRVDNSDFFHSIASGIDQYLSPFIHLYSLDSMKAKGLDLPGIFEGPLMENGFTTSEELAEKRFRKNIYTSDLVTILMDTRNVKAVRKITIRPEKGEPHFWSYAVEENKVPRISHSGTRINIWYNGTLVGNHTLSSTRIDRSLQSLPKPFDPGQLYARKPETADRPLTEYSPLQNDLPQAYGVSEYGLSGDVPPEREALAHQLKGYLRIIDQVIFNSLLQLSHARHLLAPGKIEKTYLAELVSGAPGEEFIYKPFVEEFLSTHINLENRGLLRSEWKKYLGTRKHEADTVLQAMAENQAIFHDRRNRALNHLLARSGYDLSFFEYVCGFSEEEQIAYKEKLLRLLPACDISRSILLKPGGDYLGGAQETLEGFELRLALLTGIRAETRKALAAGPGRLFAGKTGGNLEAEVYDSAGDDAIDRIFEYGGKKEMYAREKVKGKNTLVLFNQDRRPVARFSGTALDQDPAADIAEKLAAQIAAADLASEGFHLVDHLLLRPGDDAACFGFDAVIRDEVIFSCTPSLSRRERDLVTRQFISEAGKRDSYLVLEKSMRQFCVAHKASLKYLHGHMYFTSREAAEEAIGDYVQQFSRQPGIAATTSFCDLYSNTEDPFSNILTFVLPTWPSRFCNEAYRKYIEETIAQESPAHLVVNIRWLGYAQMVVFENAWSAWLKASPGDKVNRLQTLLSLLAG
ncbi:MAG: hypothetical protein FD123_4109 [Bacteroidetes bacterium]|nr:MAG: hypothetical protein FD123_4109 [Bacteroidota bacterium]